MSNYINIENGRVQCYTSKYNTEPLFVLPHQCDEWEIGNIDNAKDFVAELQKTIKELKAFLKEDTL